MYTENKGNWLNLFVEDKESLIDTMVRNMNSDLENGYNYFGNSIQRQIAELNAFKAKFDAEMESFKTMTPEQVDHWCFIDLKKRGAIL